MEFFTLIAFGVLTGILSSMFGFGGGFIIVPLLYRFVIMNCVRKKSFVKKEDKVISLSKNRHVVFGLLIGSTASLLGVGGSIITIPLMRKLGLSMKHAAAIGNMLSLPVALVGAIVYAFLGNKLNLELGNAYLGLVYLPALFVLSMTGFIGVPIGSYLVNKISDKTHAIGFILLSFISLTAILV